MSPYILRSMLFVPGHNERLLRSAAGTQADAVILDMEDSVTPDANKIIARSLCGRLIVEGLFAGKRVFVRLNDVDSEFLSDEVRAFSPLPVDGFVFPKVFNEKDIYFIDHLLHVAETENRLDDNRLKLVPIIETCGALVNLDAICRASGRIIAVAFGCEDFVADLRGVHDPQAQSLFYPRAQIAVTARYHGIIPIDSVHVDVHNMQDLEYNLGIARNLGFEGMLLLHPKEIEPAHRYFSPSQTEYENALEVVRLTGLAREQEKGVAIMNGRFIGPPMLRAARNVIRRYEDIRHKTTV